MEKLAVTPDEDGFSIQPNQQPIVSIPLDGGFDRTQLDEIGGCYRVSLQFAGSYKRVKEVRDFVNKNLGLNCPQFLMDLPITSFVFKEHKCNIIPQSISQINPKGITYGIRFDISVEPRSDENNDWPILGCETSDNAPYITRQPGNGPQGEAQYAYITIDEDAPFSISCNAIGTVPLTFTWFKINNGSDPTPIQVQTGTSNVLAFPAGLQPSDSGKIYYVVVSNAFGTVTSLKAQVIVRQIYAVVEFVKVTALAANTAPAAASCDVTVGPTTYAHITGMKNGVFAENYTLNNNSAIPNNWNYGNASGFNGIGTTNGSVSNGSARLFTRVSPQKINGIRLAGFAFCNAKIEFIDGNLNTLLTLVNVGSSFTEYLTIHPIGPFHP